MIVRHRRDRQGRWLWRGLLRKTRTTRPQTITAKGLRNWLRARHISHPRPAPRRRLSRLAPPRRAMPDADMAVAGPSTPSRAHTSDATLVYAAQLDGEGSDCAHSMLGVA